MNLQVGVKALIQDSSGKYLLLERTEPLPTGEGICWDIPGGRLIPTTNETLTTALSREIFEETGLRINENPKLLSAQDVFVPDKQLRVVRLTYLATADKTPLLRLSAEHTRYQWATAQVACDLPTDPYLRVLLLSLTAD